MSEVESLMKNWSFPMRGTERTQMTLRLPSYDHQRLHALKAVYPSRPVNEILVDIIEAALNDIQNALPVYTVTKEDLEKDFFYFHGMEEGDAYGPGVTFEQVLKRIQADSGKSDKEVAA